MFKTIIICTFLFNSLFPFNQNIVMEKTHAEVGIHSIEEDGDDVIINIYSISKVPVAGFQFQITPNDLFTIDTVFTPSNIEFDVHYNETGKILAFSMSGKTIPISRSEYSKDNILLSIYAKKNKVFFNQVIGLDPTLANSLGKKINTKVIPYIYK